jgi:uncharacterized membrane protein YkvA (DUF1232 family)
MDPGNQAQAAGTRQILARTGGLPTSHQFRLAWRLARSPSVPLPARLPHLALIVYLAMPLDIIPDFIPVLGHLDDLLIAGIAVWWFLRICPAAVATAEIERLEETPTGPLDWLVPCMLITLGGVLLAGALFWWITR